ncbi:outer membrane protein transport protein [Marinilabiliaceae bacterium ANBcel2]|nr:outer membrane protein transport protein [Marinilabiliaceae bacterium ANBcel2]
MRKLFLIALLISCFAMVKGEGYQVNLQDVRQVGMGHTGAGQILGASSIHFNPGALAFMERDFQFSGGISGVISSNDFISEYTGDKYETNNPISTPFSIYAAARLTDRLVAGIGVNTPYGNSLEWGDEWEGRYHIQDISLHAIYLRPTLSFQLSDRLSVGGGMTMVFGGVDLNRAISFRDLDPIYQSIQQDPSATVPDGQVNLEGTTTSYGFTLGALLRVSDNLNIGVGYRSKIRLKLDKGDANFSYDPVTPELLMQAAAMTGETLPEGYQFFPENNKFSSELPMPANLTFGVGWQINDFWTLAVDLQHVRWDSYEDLDFDFKYNSMAVEDAENIRNFQNTMIYRLGLEYNPLPQWLFRGGIYYDETPIPKNYLTPETPGTDKTGLSLGFSWFPMDNMSIDASILHIMGDEREDFYNPDEENIEEPFGGIYNTSAWIPGIGVTYSF